MCNKNIQADLKKLAEINGIDVLGFADASEFKDYLLGKSERRDPRLALPDAKTIIVAGIYIGGFILPSWTKPNFGRTSRLFLSGFFNDIVRQIEPISTLLKEEGYSALICDDSKDEGSIIPLKLAAVRAGIGWQGKHSLLISRKYGTFLALGGIITNANLEHNNTQVEDGCKSCRKCQEVCPLGALENAHVLHKVKCLSYILQNENNIPDEAKTVMENRIMDCEICQQICPWNAKHIKEPLSTKLTSTFQEKIAAWEDFFTFANLTHLTEHEYKNTLGCLNTGIPYLTFYRNILAAMEHEHFQ